MEFSRKDILGVFFVVLSIFIFISLMTYSSLDPSFNTSVYATAAVKNITGLIGSHVSDIMLQLFGISSFVLPLALLFAAIFVFYRSDKVTFSYLRLSVFLLLLLTVSMSLNVTLGNVNYGGATFASGGLIGRALVGVFVPYLSPIGTAILGITTTLLLLFYIVNVSAFAGTVIVFYVLYKAVSTPAKAIYKFVSSLVKWFSSRHVFKIKGDEILDKEFATGSVGFKVNVRDGTKRVMDRGLKENQKKRMEVETEDTIESDIVWKPDASFDLPPVSLLNKVPKRNTVDALNDLKATAASLQDRLRDFDVDGEIVEVSPGPVITMYEFKPAPGIKINKVANLADDLALALGCGSVRIIAPIPGKSVIGIEVPNKNRETVFIRELIDSTLFKTAEKKIPMVIGKDTEGDPFVTDLSKMPHLLVAGSTGSGKSVFINSLICSILYKFSPQEVRLIMVDPKMLELSVYDGIPHLLLPVVTEASKASQALKWAVREMTNRYEMLSSKGCRSITSYNLEAEDPMPYIVIVVDELADLMMISSKDVEASITRLAQMARAAGIHLVLATQRPSVDVITGLIKVNFPARIAFKVSSRVDSRTILDTIGAERLLGMGDMLLLFPGTNRLKRLHGAFVSDEEVKNIVDFVKKQGFPDYNIDILREDKEELEADEYDELYDEAVNIVLNSRKASISFIQRRLKIGYNRAARIMEIMEKEGVVSTQLSSGQREILVDRR